MTAETTPWPRAPSPQHRPGGRRWTLLLAALAGVLLPVGASSLAGAPAGPATAPSTPTGASLVVVSRSIGSRRGEPPSRLGHAAVLVRFEGRTDGFIVQGGPVPLAGTTDSRCMGWVIPSADPARDFARATGAFWGENVARDLPVAELARFTVADLTEARLRAVVEALNKELEPRRYRFGAGQGPSSNSFVSLVLERLGVAPPALSAADLPGWGWRP